MGDNEEEDKESNVSENTVCTNKDSTDSFNTNDSFITDNRKYNGLRFSLSNARSLAKKVTSLIDLFREKALHFAMITETWLQNNRETRNELLDIKHAEKIEFICKNRGRRGGGVAVAFDSSVASFRPLQIKNNKYELVGAVGRTTTDMRKCVVFVVYIPPKQTTAVTAGLFECLGNAIEQAKLDFADPHIVVGGDTNRRDISAALSDFPDITIAATGPTRRSACNFGCACNKF